MIQTNEENKTTPTLPYGVWAPEHAFRTRDTGFHSIIALIVFQFLVLSVLSCSASDVSARSKRCSLVKQRSIAKEAKSETWVRCRWTSTSSARLPAASGARWTDARSQVTVGKLQVAGERQDHRSSSLTLDHACRHVPFASHLSGGGMGQAGCDQAVWLLPVLHKMT
jgi:hypothetical protein